MTDCAALYRIHHLIRNGEHRAVCKSGHHLFTAVDAGELRIFLVTAEL